MELIILVRQIFIIITTVKHYLTSSTRLYEKTRKKLKETFTQLEES